MRYIHKRIAVEKPAPYVEKRISYLDEGNWQSDKKDYKKGISICHTSEGAFLCMTNNTDKVPSLSASGTYWRCIALAVQEAKNVEPKDIENLCIAMAAELSPKLVNSWLEDANILAGVQIERAFELVDESVGPDE